MHKLPAHRSVLKPPLLPLGVSVALSLLGDLTLFTSLVTRLEALQLTLPQLGILFSVHRIIRIPGNPLAGWLADRFGRRPMFVIGMVLAVGSTLGYGFAVGFVSFLIFRLAWGAAWALINTTGMTITMDISSDGERGKLSGIYNTWLWLGFGLAPFLGGFLVDLLSFRNAMFILSGLTSIGLLTAFIFLPETREVDSAPAQPHRVQLHGSLKHHIADLRKLNWQAMIMMAVFLFTGEGLLLSTLSLLLENRFGAQLTFGQTQLGIASIAGTLFMLRAVLAGVTGPLAGHASDRRGRLPAITLSALLGAASLVILLYAGNLAFILVGILISAVSSAAGGAILAAWMGDSTRRESLGKSFGWFAMVGDIGSSLGPLFALLIYPSAGLAPAYWFGAALFVLGAGWLNVTRVSPRDAKPGSAV